MEPPSTLSHTELMRRSSIAATVIKAALVRSAFSDKSLGQYEMTTPQGIVKLDYTADFTKPRNLFFIDRYFIPKVKEWVAEADTRGQTTAIRQIFGAQALYAVQLGTVSTFTFNEISEILFPEVVAARPVSEMGKILAFPGAHHRGFGS